MGVDMSYLLWFLRRSTPSRGSGRSRLTYCDYPQSRSGLHFNALLGFRGRRHDAAESSVSSRASEQRHVLRREERGRDKIRPWLTHLDFAQWGESIATSR
ncbi:hypothetical protein R1flu_010164 [Riccia fluitans]|uniref:Uncharacterized protein n=1 Tax=Riccia fluitans TaxID=41844 RepID=A0ABD1Z783_9MARC